MGRRKRNANMSTFSRSPRHDVAVGDNATDETTAAERDVSNLVMMDTEENKLVSQSECNAEMSMEQIKIKNNGVMNNETDEHKTNAAEEQKGDKELAAEGGDAKEGNHIHYDDFDQGGDDDDGIGGGGDNDDDDDDIDDDDDDGFDDDGVDDDDDEDEDDDDMDDDLDTEEVEYVIWEEENNKKEKVVNNDSAIEEDKDNQEDTIKGEGKEKNTKEGNEARGGALKEKVKTLRKGSTRKKVKEGASNNLTFRCEDKQKDVLMQEEDGENAIEIEEKGETSSKQKAEKSSHWSRSKNIAAGGFERVTCKREDKPESSDKKKSLEKVKIRGMIFMCNSKTKKDCYRYKVLGLPANKRDIVEKVYKGMTLFLYDFNLKLMYGIYKAAGPGGYNIQPKAFNSQFPAQVRFRILEDYLPLAEEKFKKVIKDNYFTKSKFDCQLTSKQVMNLCKLFAASRKGPRSKKLGRTLRQRALAPIDRGRPRDRSKERRSALNDKRRYHGYPHEREVVAHPGGLVSRHAPLPPPAATLSYAHDRASEMDIYRQDTLVELRDSYRQPVLEPRDAYRPVHLFEHPDAYRQAPRLDHRDSYGRDVVVDHRDLRFGDEIDSHDPYIYYRERPKHRDIRFQDEIRRHDPYVSYPEHPAYRDPIYTRGPLPEHDCYRRVGRSTDYHDVGRSADYRSAVAPLPEYHSGRPLYRS